MKALVLSGGTGTRLRPITYTSAKQLVPIGNKPILFYGLESIAESGVTEVGMIVGDTSAQVIEAVGDGSQFGLKVTYIQQEKPLGLAHCVLIARDYLGDDDFVMYLGDNFILNGIEGFVRSFGDRDDGVSAQILLAEVDNPEKFGVAVLDDEGRVVTLVEKPTVPPSNLALVGVYLFDATIHGAVRAIAPSARGELEITDAIAWLIDNGASVRSTIVDDYWKDLGDPQALLEGNRLVLDRIRSKSLGEVSSDSRIEGKVILSEGARVASSVIRGPVVIGEGATISGSFIGPYTSIGPDCTIVDSEIENSIVLSESTISGIVRLEGSVVGKGAKISRRTSRPSASRLVIGDNSQVEMSLPSS